MEYVMRKISLNINNININNTNNIDITFAVSMLHLSKQSLDQSTVGGRRLMEIY